MKKTRLERTIVSLEQHGFEVQFFKTGREAADAALREIPQNASIGLGGSATVKTINLLEAVLSGQYRLFNQYNPQLSPDEQLEMRRRGMLADYYLTGTNAITETGELVNVDGIGNRVAAQIFGAPRVLIFASVKKIVKDVDAALERIRTIAAPLNARRFGIDVPCIHGEPCSKCPTDKTLCNITAIIHHQRTGRIKIFLIDEDLGY